MTEPVRLPVPVRVSQATHIEQGRAAAEVFAAMQAAQALPRDENDAVRRMREACARRAFADRAFYAVPRGGNTATGPSVHLMRELARIFGNIHYGLAELDRDPVGPDRDRGRSEMVAFAWDLEANVRNSSTFIIEHARDRSAWQDRAASVDPLTTLQSVYENNANLGARRVRTAIRAVLPVWFVDEAIELCNAALVKGDGKPLADRLADTLAWFDVHLGVRRERIEARLGKPSGRWTAQDLADLGVIGNSIRRNETTADEAFPARPVLPEELPAAGPRTSAEAVVPAAGAESPAATDPTASPAPAATFPADGVTEPDPSDQVPKQEDAQVSVGATAGSDEPPTIGELLDRLDVKDKGDRWALVALYIGRPVKSLTGLTVAERATVLAALQTIAGQDDEGRAADLARDLEEARSLAAGRSGAGGGQ